MNSQARNFFILTRLLFSRSRLIVSGILEVARALGFSTLHYMYRLCLNQTRARLRQSRFISPASWSLEIRDLFLPSNTLLKQDLGYEVHLSGRLPQC